MFAYFNSNKQFLIVICIWLITGIYFPTFTYILVPFTFFLMWQKHLTQDIFIGFFAILIFSDSFILYFAKDVKPILLLILALFYFTNQKIFPRDIRIAQPFYVFFLYAIVLLFNSVTFLVSFQKTLSYILLYLLIPGYLVKIYRERGPEFFKNLICFGIVILFAGIVLKYTNPEVAISHGTRYRGVFGNPNGVAMFCVLIYMLYYVLDQYYVNLFSRTEKILIFLTIFTSILFSGSRSSMMCIIIFWLFSWMHKKSNIVSAIFFIVVIISFQIISDNALEIIKSLDLTAYFRLDTIKEGSGRVFAWRYAWEEIQKNFFFGKGFDYNQYLFFIKETQSKLNMLNHQGDVHNVYLGFWLDVGLVGLVLFFSAFIYTFYKASLNSHLAFPIMYAMLFMGNYEPWLIASLNPYTIQFLIIVTILIYCKPNNKDSQVLVPIAVT